MKNLCVAAALAAGLAGAAQASDEAGRVNPYDSSDFAARAYWRADFGGAAAGTQGLGLRFDNESAYAVGAPAALQFQLGQGAVQVLSVNGLDLRSNLAAAQSEGGFTAFFQSLTGPQLFALGVAVTATTAIAVTAADDDDEPEATGASSP